MIDYQELKKLGLTDKEAQVYLASLTRGPETGTNLALFAEVARPTAYVVYDSLVKKGLMSTQTKGKKTFYIAESPEHLLSYMRMQRKELEEKERELEGLLPELKKIANTKGNKPNVRVFEGFDGLKKIQEDIIRSKAKEIHVVTSLDELYRLFPEKEHTESMTKRRIQEKITSKVLYNYSKGPVFEKTDKKMKRKSKFIDNKKYEFKIGMDIYADKVGLYTFKDNIVGILIENKEIADTLKAMFDMCWDNYNEKEKKTK